VNDPKEQNDATVRITIALHAAHLAKVSLEMMNLNPSLARLQFSKVISSVNELGEFLKGVK
jgi:hypothetical protein